MRDKLDDDGFRREGLGIWPTHHWSVFDCDRWANLIDLRADVPARAVLVVYVSPGRASACIGPAGPAPGGRTLVMCFCGDGTAWVAPKVAHLVASRDIVEVGLAPGEARALAADLTKAGVKFRPLTGSDIAAGCSAFQTAVDDGTVCHVGQPELETAVASAATKRVAGAETWDCDSAVVPASAAFYRWGVQDAPMPAIY